MTEATHHALPDDVRALMARVAVDAGMSLEQRKIPSFDHRGRDTGQTVEILILQYPPESAPKVTGPDELGETVRLGVTMAAVYDDRLRFNTIMQSQSAYGRNVNAGQSKSGSMAPRDMIMDIRYDSNSAQLQRSLANILLGEKAESLVYVGERLGAELFAGEAAPTPMSPTEVAEVITRRIGYGEGSAA